MSSLVACPQHLQVAVTIGQAERSGRLCFQDRVAAATDHFHQDRHLNRRNIFKQNRSVALAEWRQLAA